MNDSGLRVSLLKWFPFALSLAFFLVAVWVWPSDNQFGPVFLNWLNVGLFLMLALSTFVFGVRALLKKDIAIVPTLRVKLVVAMVLMVLIPSLVLQVTATQLIERGMHVWFDVRVDNLLDKAMKLAQGFYSGIEADMELSLAQVASDGEFQLEVKEAPLGAMILSQHLSKMLGLYGWHKAELFDVSERPIAVSQRDFRGQSLSDLKTLPVSDAGKLSIALARHTIEHVVRDNGEYVVGYLPLFQQQHYVGMLRAEVLLPAEVSASARSIESDYRTYKELDRHREGIQEIFTHILMIAMVLITGLAWMVAFVFARRVTSPVEQLAHAFENVEAGNLDVVVPVASKDELGSLSQSFNSMATRLSKNMEVLTKTQDELRGALVSSRQRQFVLENLLANLQSGVILLDASGSVRLMNQACQDLLFLADKGLDKKSIFDFSEVHLAPVLDFFKVLQTEGHESLQLELDLMHGLQPVKILARGTLLGAHEDTIFAGWLLVFDDVTKLADAQKHQAWSEVAQRLAHEIKNPLTPIKLSTERVQRRFRKQVDDVEVFDTCTAAVISQVERLQRLLADFSNLATMPKPKTELVSISELLKDMKELYSTYQNIVFEGMPAGEVCCDPDQIRQVLINLIDNALATKSLVRVFVEVEGEGIGFYVQDEGAGIDEHTQKHMFEPYFSTKEEGSGLGLAIAQRITEEHNGHLQLVSASGPTRFCMWLPRVLKQGSEGMEA